MRTITPFQRQTIAGQRVGHYFWAEIEHADRRYRDLTNFNGVDWVDSAEWSDSIDQPCGTFTLRLRRDIQLDSIAPTMGAGKANLLQNLLLWSEDISNASWVKATGGVASLPVVTPNFALAPDGVSLTADRVQLALNGGTTTTDISTCRQSVVTVVGKSYVLSVWLRTNDGTTKTVGLYVTSSGISNVTVTPQWQRFTSNVWVATGTGAVPQLRLRGAEGTSDSADLLVWGAQVNQSATPLEYAFTTNAIVNTFAPLLDTGRNVRFYTAVTQGGLRPGTNYLKFSEQFDNAAWTKTAGVTVTPNAVASPDGSVTADVIVYDGSGVNASYRIYSGAQVPYNIPGAGVQFISSVWLRAAAPMTVRIATNTGQFTVCNLTTQWQRFSVVGTGNGASAAQLLIYSNVADNAAWTIYAWGAQLDAGSTLSDYIPTTATSGATSKRMVFQGRVDAIKWNNDPIELTGRDLGGWVVDAFIQQERVIGSATPTAIETLMAQVLANDPVYGTPTIYTPASPGFLVANPTLAKQAKKSVLEALQQDYALSLGWVCRYRWDDTTNNSRLTFFDVNRAKTVADDSFGPTEYEDITSLELNDAEVRNYIVGTYYDAAGKQHSRTAQNATSQGKYGVKFMQIDLALGDPIDSDAEMDTMLNAAVNDLGSPLTTQEMSTLYYWPIQLGDLYTFVQNGDHYDSDQKLAVVSFTHKFEAGQGKTTMQCRGTVIGAYHAWFRRGTNDGGTSTDGLPFIQEVDVGFPAGVATVEVVLRGDVNTGSWRIALSTTAQPDLATTRAAPVYTGQNIDVLISQSVSTGQKLYISVLAYSGVTGAGAESDLFQSSTTRDGSGGPIMPVPNIVLVYSDFTEFQLNFKGTWSPGAPLPNEFRYGVSTDATGATITWSAWTDKAFLPFDTGMINRQDKAATYYMLEVRQGSDNSTIQRQTIVMDGIDVSTGTDGLLIRSKPFNDGGFALKATDTNGNIINPSGQESGLKLVNLLLAKPLASGPDNLNSVGDGSTRAAVAPGSIDTNASPLLISIPDTRATTHAPTYYNRNLRGQFKAQSAVGLPAAGSGFAQVFGWRGWVDDSGDGVGELAANADGRIYYRYGTTAGGWNAWNELARKSEVLSSAGGTLSGLLTANGGVTAGGAGAWSSSAWQRSVMVGNGGNIVLGYGTASGTDRFGLGMSGGILYLMAMADDTSTTAGFYVMTWQRSVVNINAGLNANSGISSGGDIVLASGKLFKDSFGNSMAPIIVSSLAASGTAADKTLWVQV